MSMISEQINILRDAVIRLQALDLPNTANEVKEAADTIEELSAKLASANMERSTAYYNDGWIPVSSGKLPVGEGYEYYDPEEDMTYYKQVLVHTDEVDIPYCVAYYDTDTWFCAVTSTPLVVDRWKLIEPYQPKGEK